MRNVTHYEIQELAHEVAMQLAAKATQLGRSVKVYPIPRGGVPAFYAVQAAYNALPKGHGQRPKLMLASAIEGCDVILDDLVDSGGTYERAKAKNPKADFYSLIHKGQKGWAADAWLVFPWEKAETDKSIDDAFTRILQYVGEDVKRGGLAETPARMAKAWAEWTQGYKQNPADVLKLFEDGAEGYDELVLEKNIPFYSLCEHHGATFFGNVTFGYIPDKKVVGLSKMNRLVEVFARRLQVQERMTRQILDAFCEHVKPLGAGIIVKARHMCVESRGIRHQGCETTTSAFTGVFRDGDCTAARNEFMTLCSS